MTDEELKEYIDTTVGKYCATVYVSLVEMVANMLNTQNCGQPLPNYDEVWNKNYNYYRNLLLNAD